MYRMMPRLDRTCPTVPKQAMRRPAMRRAKEQEQALEKTLRTMTA
jgi:hypothetical protein